MASEMVERIARALMEADAGGDPEWDYTAEAIAAIRAMREPSEGMSFAGMAAKPDHPVKDNTLDRHKRIVTSIYAAMIDAAIAEAE